MRNIIRACIPDVSERIAWSMPIYEKPERSVSFAACQKHISFYVGIETIEKFKPRLGEFATNKNAIYLPYNKKLPVKLIEDIVKRCLN